MSEIKKAEEIFKEYWERKTGRRAVESILHHMSFCVDAIQSALTSRQSEIDDIQKEWFKRGYESIQDEVERLKDDYKELRKIADVQVKHIDVQDQLIYDQTKEIDELKLQLKQESECVEAIKQTCDNYEAENKELKAEIESNLKEKMYFNRMKEIVFKVAYDSENYSEKTHEVLRKDALSLLEEYINQQNK